MGFEPMASRLQSERSTANLPARIIEITLTGFKDFKKRQVDFDA